MEWSKIKNIIILILLAMNGFLLVQTVYREQQSRQYLEESRAGAVEVLRRQGYVVADGALPGERSLTACGAERSRESEETLATYLLGSARKTEDGVFTAYAGERGDGWFRSDGSFAFTFTSGSYSAPGGEAAYAVKLLTGGGYPCEIVDAGPETVTVRQTWEGVPVFPCTAELTYQDGALTAIKGTRLIGLPVREGGGATGMDVSTALIRFMVGMREGGHVFTRIEDLTSGYQTTGSGRRMALEPVWRVTTDAGVFFMDGVTGELSLT